MAGRRIVADARVMSSGDARGADLSRGCDKIVKLDVVVTERARNGDALQDNRRRNGRMTVCSKAAEIDDVERDAEVAGDAAGVMHVVDGAAAMPRSPVAQGSAASCGRRR